jgi:hypothetical protein
MTSIERGDVLRLRNAAGDWIAGRALSRVAEGPHPTVWVCAEDQWPDFKDASHEAGVPWPIEDVDVDATQPA